MQNGYLHNSNAFHFRGRASNGNDPLGISDDDQPLPHHYPHLHQTPPWICSRLVQQNSQSHLQQPHRSFENQFHQLIQLTLKIILFLQIRKMVDDERLAWINQKIFRLRLSMRSNTKIISTLGLCLDRRMESRFWRRGRFRWFSIQQWYKKIV